MRAEMTYNVIQAVPESESTEIKKPEAVTSGSTRILTPLKKL